MRRVYLILALIVAPALAGAEDARVLDVKLRDTGPAWRIDVTIRHPDTGWDHYVDGWEVLDADGNRLGYRQLLHPHVDEQPFTRSLGGLALPDGAGAVFVRTHCSQDGWSDQLYRVPVTP